jgi:ribonuclease P protein component
MKAEVQSAECKIQNEETTTPIEKPPLHSALCTLHSALFRFPRSHRLSGKLAFSAVYDAKMKTTRGPLAAYSLPNDLGHPRLGISISRKVGTAPVRNRIKRLLREAFRLHRYDLPRGYDLVIVVRPHVPLELADYQKILADLIFKSHQRHQAAAANS